MQITIEIDETLLRRARGLTGLRSTQKIVHLALKLLVMHAEQQAIRTSEARRRAEQLTKRSKKFFGRFAQ
jgi:Arc/MetJ family transcription regulator